MNRNAMLLMFAFLALVVTIWITRNAQNSVSEDSDIPSVVTPVVQDILTPAAKTPTPDENQPSDPTLDFRNPEAQETIRARWDNSPDLPDGIAFSSVLHLLQASSQLDSDSAINMARNKFGVDEDSAVRLSEGLLEIAEKLRTDVAREQNNILCDNGVPKIYGDEVFSSFEYFETYQDAQAEYYYHSFSNSLPEEEAEALTNWVESQKLSTSVIRFDYRKRYELRGTNVDAKAAQFCLMLANANTQQGEQE